MSIDYQKELNLEQFQAVEHIQGPLRLVAGPGAGKTRTITYKIAYLINVKKVAPYKILAVTFTNKATAEMRERLTKMLGIDVAKQIWIHTYHAFCSMVLRYDGAKINIANTFKILDRDDQTRLFGQIFEKNNIEDFKDRRNDLKRDVLNYLADIKNERMNIAEVEKEVQAEKVIVKIINDYMTRQKELNVLDFDDLIYETLKLFRTNEQARDYWASKFEFIMVDEFQDTNDQQYELVKHLTSKNKNITIVGDDDQAIYSFRGANTKLFFDFEKDFGAKTIILNTNYRSTRNIVAISNELVSQNKQRVRKTILAASTEDGPKVKFYNGDSVDMEAGFIAKEVKELIKNGEDEDQIAVLFRIGAISRSLESLLVANSINYRLVGALSFFKYRNVKDAINYFTLLLIDDDYSLDSIINVPSRKVGQVTLAKLTDYSVANKKSMLDSIPLFNSKMSPELERLFVNTKKYQAMLESSIKDEDFESIPTIVYDYLDSVGFVASFKEEDEKARVTELMNSIGKWISDWDRNVEFKEYLMSMINTVSLSSDSENSLEKSTVKLMTIHSSKGLEFNNVFVFGMVDGTMPSERSIEHNLEEERRVAYVAFTRARKALYLTSNTGLSWARKPNLPSRFLEPIKSHLERLDTRTIYKQVWETKSTYAKVDNSDIVHGDTIWHEHFGEGIVIEDAGKIIKIAFDRKVGVKTFFKDHPTIRKTIKK